MEKRSRLQPLARAVLRTQSDHRLVALAREGKDAAFEEIVRRYRPALVAFAAAYGPPDAEDVVQESFVRAWDALRETTREMHLKAWLYTIVRNRALNARRDSRAHEQLTEQMDGVLQPPEIALTNDELRRAVAAIGALPEPQREALVRSAIEGHTHEQIAAAIGSSPGAARQLIYRARMSVRNGVGALIPLPLVAAFAELGAGGAGAVAGGTAVAGAAGGASLAMKTAVVAAIGAVAIGSGVAIERASGPDRKDARATQSTEPQAAGRDGGGESRGTPPTPVAGTDDRSGEDSRDSSGERSGDDGGGSESGDDRSGSGDDSGPSQSSGPGPGPAVDDSSNSGSGSSGSDSSGSGSGSSGSGSSGSDSSGSGSSGSSSSGSGGSSGPGGGDDAGGTDNSGPGGGDGTTVPDGDSSGPGDGGETTTTTTTTTTTVPDDDHSGPGGGGGSGSSGSGGSGSGGG